MLKFILSLILTSSLTFAAKHHEEFQDTHLEPWYGYEGLAHQESSSQERQIIDVAHAIRQLREIETGDAGSLGSLDDFLASLEDSPASSQEGFDRALVQNLLDQSTSGILEGLERWYATTIDRPSVYYREGANVYVTSSGESGRILTIDERRGVATVEFDPWGWWNTKKETTHLLRELAVASGCLKEELCVGQQVYTTSNKWNQYTIEAIDYFANRVVIKKCKRCGEFPGVRRKISTASPDELLLRQGCLERTYHGENFCVGSRFTVQRRGRRRHSYTSGIEIVAIGKSILLVRYLRSGEEDRREFLRPNQLNRRILDYRNY